MLSIIKNWWSSLSDNDKIMYSIYVAVPTLILIYFWSKGIDTMDELIAWIASWPVWIISKILYFFTQLIKSITKGLKDAVTKKI